MAAVDRKWHAGERSMLDMSVLPLTVPCELSERRAIPPRTFVSMSFCIISITKWSNSSPYLRIDVLLYHLHHKVEWSWCDIIRSLSFRVLSFLLFNDSYGGIHSICVNIAAGFWGFPHTGWNETSEEDTRDTQSTRPLTVFLICIVPALANLLRSICQ